MALSYKDLTNEGRDEVKKQAIKLIDECIEKDEGFVVYTSAGINGDIMSASNKQLYVIIGALLLNTIMLNNEDTNQGFPKEELQRILDKAEEIAEREKNKSKKVMNSVDEYLVKVLEDLKNKIENLEKNEEEK